MKVNQVLENVPSNGIIVREEGDIVRVFFDIEKQKAETSKNGEVIVPDGMCTMENVDVFGTRTYDGIVNAIVCDHYPADKMQAIINNHLLESESKEHQAEFAEMQAWRAKAKIVAKEVVSMIV
uniref:Uncharacterized protein n=1 Tax=virus sp. ctKgb28 TaxID=2826799 RepID=A0A8S5R735_9VIRU|nr:MAG TPA: hypothetical protein [virus sp. ctKgb28]